LRQLPRLPRGLSLFDRRRLAERKVFEFLEAAVGPADAEGVGFLVAEADGDGEFALGQVTAGRVGITWRRIVSLPTIASIQAPTASRFDVTPLPTSLSRIQLRPSF
jgi:hypothetical protein